MLGIKQTYKKRINQIHKEFDQHILSLCKACPYQILDHITAQNFVAAMYSKVQFGPQKVADYYPIPLKQNVKLKAV